MLRIGKFLLAGALFGNKQGVVLQCQMLEPDVEPFMSPIAGKSHAVKADSPRKLGWLVVISIVCGSMSLIKTKWLDKAV